MPSTESMALAKQAKKSAPVVRSRCRFQHGGADFLSAVRFDSLPIHAHTKRALAEELRYTHLSMPQSVFLPRILTDPAGHDVFVKAGTGTGKTLGFLIPVLEALTSAPPPARGTVGALVLSPARELALQTCGEAQRLMRFWGGAMTAQAIIGGTNRGQDVRALSRSAPSVLVATPGRLEDVLTDAAARASLVDARAVVLDEADRLLDMGFVQAVRRILGALRAPRRTLMFTATVTPEVLDVARRFLRPGYTFIDTPAELEVLLPPGQSARLLAGQGSIEHRAVIVSPPSALHLALHRVVQERRAADPSGHKVLVFLSSNAAVHFYAALFERVFKMHAMVLTGDLPQAKRQRASEAFRTGSGMVLFASDVAGRGMDFPRVTCVVQVGAAPPDVYQQRAGRTGRGGLTGEAVTVLGDDEGKVAASMAQRQPGLATERWDQAAELRAYLQAHAPLQGELAKDAAQAFRGMLGATNGLVKALGWSKQQLVDAIAARFYGAGLARLPEINAKTLGKMGLQGVRMPGAPAGAQTQQRAGGTTRKLLRASAKPLG